LAGSGSAALSGSNTYVGNQTISGSLIVTGTISGSFNNFQGTPTHIPFFSSSQVLADSTIFQVDNGPGQGFSVAINENAVTTAAPEALYVYQPSTSSYNVISGKGNLNNYLQLNIQNTNQGNNASSDVVATAHNGNETTNYIDMGINGLNFSGSLGVSNDAYLYSTGKHLHIGNASNYPVQFFAGDTNTDSSRKLSLSPNNQHELTGSLNISGSLVVRNAITIGSLLTNSHSITGSLNITGSVLLNGLNIITGNTSSLTVASASYATYAVTASYADNFTVKNTLSSSVLYVSASSKFGNAFANTHQFTGSVNITGSLTVNGTVINNLTSSNAVSASYATTASYASNAVSSSYSSNAGLFNGKDITIFATTGSNIFKGTQTVTGSLLTSGSNTLVGNTVLTGSLSISGSTVQTGNNALTGNTTLSGSITISGNTLITGSITATNVTASFGYVSASFIDVTGKQTVRGYTQYLPTSDIVPISTVGGYIYSSGSQGDLYFAQTNGALNNVTKLRWLEGNMYSGLLNGGIIGSASSTVYTVSSGSGLIVNLGGSLSADPYPTIQYINWNTLSASIAPLSASYDQTFVAIYPTGSTGTVYAQGIPYNDGQFDTLIPIGVVLHQNHATINGVKTQPSLAYGYKQRSSTFIQAFGPLKLSGFPISTSGSLGLTVGSGYAFSDGANYPIDPNNPSYITDAGTSVSKIFRYYQSGSEWVYGTNGGAGYTTIDPGNYSNNGVLTAVPGSGANKEWSIQRAFWYPNSNTKAIVVYYGNATYASSTEALTNIQIESFTEAPNTAANAIYLGAVIVRNDAVFTTAASYQIAPGGLFRSVGGQAGGGGTVVSSTLASLSDVSISGQTNGQPLVWNSTANRWVNQSTLTATLTGNASTATSASYAATASYVPTAISSSYATTASFLLGSVASSSYAATASYVLNAVSSSFSTTSSYAIGGGTNIGNTNLSLTAARTLTLNSQSLTIAGTTSSVFFANGNVGIGTTIDAGYKLNVSGSTIISYPATTDFPLVIKNTNASATLSNVLSFDCSATGADQPVFINLASANAKGMNFFASNQAISTSPAAAAFQLFSNTSTNFPGQLFFSSGADDNAAIIFRTAATDGTITERMRIDASGNVFIGNPTDVGDMLQVNGNISSYSGNVIAPFDNGFILMDDIGPDPFGRIVRRALNSSYGVGYYASSYYNYSQGHIFGLLYTDNYAHQSGTRYGIQNLIGMAAAGAGNGSTINTNLKYTINNTGAQTGTFTGLTIDATETALNGVTHSLMDLKVGGTTKLKVTNDGSISVNTTSPNTSSLLDLTSTTKGFLAPRMTTTQRDAITTPATGLSVYNTTTNTQDYYNGAAWVSLSTGASSVFPYTGTAVITGSLVVTTAIQLDGTLTNYATVASSIVGANNMFTQATGSYTSAFIKYTVSNTTNARSGEIMAVWNGATVQYTDTSTLDIGSTTAVTGSVSIVSSQFQYNIQTSTSGWKLKAMATFM
jgi:hypothetical protein